jgi:membrane-associated PAP2 superfamily phosphatase
MTRTASLVWSVVEIIGALFLMLFAAVLVIVGIGFATDAPHNLDGELGKGIFCWLIAIAMTFIAIVLYRHSIRRLRPLPMAWSVVEIILAGFLLLCAGCVGILGFAATHGGPHAFPADLRIGMVCWLIALAMTIIAIVWFRRSSRRLRSLRELCLHESHSEMGKR